MLQKQQLVKLNCFFEHNSVKDTIESKEDVKSHVADQLWKLSLMPLGHTNTEEPSHLDPEAQWDDLHPVYLSITKAWLVSSSAENHFWYAGRTNFHLNAPFRKANLCGQKNPFGWNKKEPQVRIFTVTLYFIGPTKWHYLDLICQGYWNNTSDKIEWNFKSESIFYLVRQQHHRRVFFLLV